MECERKKRTDQHSCAVSPRTRKLWSLKIPAQRLGVLSGIPGSRWPFESRLSQEGEKSTLPLVCPEAGFSDDVNRIHKSGNSFLQGDFFNPGTVGSLSWIILGWRWVAGGCPVHQTTLSSISATLPHPLDASNKLPSQL